MLYYERGSRSCLFYTTKQSHLYILICFLFLNIMRDSCSVYVVCYLVSPTLARVLRSGVIWQLDKGGKKKQAWKTLQNSVIAVLEQAYQQKHTDVKVKDLAVSTAQN